MKSFVIFSILTLTIASCTSVKQIGRVNMISIRNIDSKLEYELISSYSGGSKNELRKSKATTIEDALDQTVRKVPGGEFLMNAKIYIIDDKYIAVEGDVWGFKSNASYRGFTVGDRVTWKAQGTFKYGTIKSLKDDKTCIIETDNGDTIEKKYDDISKAQ